MGDAENAVPPSKKRAAGRELSRDNPGLDDEESPEQEGETFKKASDEVMANRRIVKVRRQQTASTPSSNPFAGIRLVPPTEPISAPAEVSTEAQAASEKTVSRDTDEKDDESKGTENEKDESRGTKNEKDDESKGTEKEKDENQKQPESETDESVAESAADKEKSDIINEASKTEGNDEKAAEDEKTGNEGKEDRGGENADSSAEAPPFSSFQQLSSSQNAFTGLAGTGFSSSTFSFGSISKDGSGLGGSSGSLFGPKSDQSSFPTFGFGLSNNGNSSLFGSQGAPIISTSLQEVPVETGEENEKAVFTADSVLFEFFDGGWKERGKGELKVNVSRDGVEKARLVMRAKGNYRLILNASLYPDMKLTNMEKRGITFACMNSVGEGKDGLSTFALKFKDASIVEEFRAAVTAHKGKTATVMNTPENSPKASDD
ncbi:hypothetical protein PVL29_011462 [Vitis rotundifolia]|uniref:RanBD1 domain-containing protein n=1 Tax=Vitis rotundifolia TaxID=103349 RepID=A0AA38ZNM0_VITRO|nr:hypothetical protein PVL29_011462 [Vitis rotundifolia]